MQFASVRRLLSMLLQGMHVHAVVQAYITFAFSRVTVLFVYFVVVDIMHLCAKTERKGALCTIAVVEIACSKRSVSQLKR